MWNFAHWAGCGRTVHGSSFCSRASAYAIIRAGWLNDDSATAFFLTCRPLHCTNSKGLEIHSNPIERSFRFLHVPMSYSVQLASVCRDFLCPATRAPHKSHIPTVAYRAAPLIRLPFHRPCRWSRSRLLLHLFLCMHICAYNALPWLRSFASLAPRPDSFRIICFPVRLMTCMVWPWAKAPCPRHFLQCAQAYDQSFLRPERRFRVLKSFGFNF